MSRYYSSRWSPHTVVDVGFVGDEQQRLVVAGHDVPEPGQFCRHPLEKLGLCRFRECLVIGEGLQQLQELWPRVLPLPGVPNTSLVLRRRRDWLKASW